MYDYTRKYRWNSLRARRELGPLVVALPEAPLETRSTCVPSPPRRKGSWGAWAVAAALGLTALKAEAATPEVIGTTPATIDASFVATINRHLSERMTHGGSTEVYQFLWSLSALQYYELEQVYNYKAGPTAFSQMLAHLLGNPGYRPALLRLGSVNNTYGPMTTVPGGRKSVQKVITIGGFPINYTMTEIWMECVTTPGVSAAEGLAAGVLKLAGPLGASFYGGYKVGELISWVIQTYDPSIQVAIGDFIGDTLNGTVSVMTPTELSIAIQVAAFSSPGVNLVDYDSYQLGDGSLIDLKVGQ